MYSLQNLTEHRNTDIHKIPFFKNVTSLTLNVKTIDRFMYLFQKQPQT